VQKLQYLEDNETVREYLSCPTVGDGDCFFHAAFTDPEEDTRTVQDKAANMRKLLCDAVQQGEYLDDLKPLVYEHYMELLANNNDHLEVPDNIKQYMQNKNDYTNMYNNMQRFEIPIDNKTTPNPETRFPADKVKGLITPDQIKNYIERFRQVGGYETYIPFRPDILCPVEILANIGQKKISIFTFNTTEKKLQFHKTAGTVGPLVRIVHTGNHFVRLYRPHGSEGFLRQCDQILANYYTSVGK
jgi:hypothetical protein